MHIPLSYNPMSLKRYFFFYTFCFPSVGKLVWLLKKVARKIAARKNAQRTIESFLLYITGNNIKRFILTIVDKINSIEILWEIYKRYSYGVAKIPSR